MDLVENQTVTLNLLRNSLNLANAPPITDYCANLFYWSMNHYSPSNHFFPKALLRNIYRLKGKCTMAIEMFANYKPVHQHIHRYTQEPFTIGWKLIHHWLYNSTIPAQWCTGYTSAWTRILHIPRQQKSRTSRSCWPLRLYQRRNPQAIFWNPEKSISVQLLSCFLLYSFRQMLVIANLHNTFSSKDTNFSMFKLLVSRWHPWILNTGW